MRRFTLPVLRHRDDLRVPAPCDEDFEAMTPEGAGRRCAACSHVVHDMSAMTEREAAQFLASREGQRTCVHFELRPDGAILFRREPARPLAPVVAVALAACTPHGPPEERRLELTEAALPAATVPTTTVPVARVAPEPPAPAAPEVVPCPGPDDKAKDPTRKRPPKKKRGLDVIDGFWE